LLAYEIEREIEGAVREYELSGPDIVGRNASRPELDARIEDSEPRRSRRRRGL
jgi:hypothetical protein